jgi:hypothetical protein
MTETFDPQTASGMHVGLYFGRYASRNCAWNREGARPEDVTVVAILDERYPRHVGAELEPLPRNMQVFKASEKSPAAVLKIRNMGEEILFSIEPLTPPEAGRTPFMSGGSLAETTDSRWSQLLGSYLGKGRRFYAGVHVHDYSETWAAYNRNFD